MFNPNAALRPSNVRAHTPARTAPATNTSQNVAPITTPSASQPGSTGLQKRASSVGASVRKADSERGRATVEKRMGTTSDNALRGRQVTLGNQSAMAAEFTESVSPQQQKQQLYKQLSQLIDKLEGSPSRQKTVTQSKTQAQQAQQAQQGLTGSPEQHVLDDPQASLKQLIENPRIQPKTLEALIEFVELFNGTNIKLHVDFKPHAAELCKGVLQEIAFPEKICQHAVGTCASTTVQMALAVENPTKYLKLMKALVSNQGVIQLSDKGYLQRHREDTTGKKEVRDDSSGRSMSSRLIQNAFAKFATDSPVYQKSEAIKGIEKHLTSGGLLAGQTLHLLQAVTGTQKICLIGPSPTAPVKGEYQDFEKFRAKLSAREAVFKPLEKACVEATSTQSLLQAIRNQTEAGRPVPVGLELDEGGHSVLVTHVDDEHMYFMNPWGALHKMPAEAACLCLNEAFMPVPAQVAQGAQQQNSKTQAFEPGLDQRGGAETAEKRILTGAIANKSNYQNFDMNLLPQQKIIQHGQSQLAQALLNEKIEIPPGIDAGDNPIAFIAKIRNLPLQKDYIQQVIPLLKSYTTDPQPLKQLNIDFLKAMLSSTT